VTNLACAAGERILITASIRRYSRNFVKSDRTRARTYKRGVPFNLAAAANGPDPRARFNRSIYRSAVRNNSDLSSHRRRPCELARSGRARTSPRDDENEIPTRCFYCSASFWLRRFHRPTGLLWTERASERDDGAGSSRPMSRRCRCAMGMKGMKPGHAGEWEGGWSKHTARLMPT